MSVILTTSSVHAAGRCIKGFAFGILDQSWSKIYAI